MICTNCHEREATTTATAYQLWGMRDHRTATRDDTPASVCAPCAVFPRTMAGREQSVLGDEPIGCDYCHQSWCKGHCVPAPEPREEVADVSE